MNREDLKKINNMNELFKIWREVQCNEDEESLKLTKHNNSKITKEHFCIDGIIDEDVYKKQGKKILFISNEANIVEYDAPKEINRIEDFKRYYESGQDEWKGKMRERICALYKVISGIEKDSIPDNKVAINFAFMNINKRGGSGKIDSHVYNYCKAYKEFIVREIELISPDYIVWIGTKTYELTRDLGVVNDYFLIENKKIPVIKMWHTSYYQGKIKPLPGYKNKVIGKLCAKLKQEMEYYEI